MTGKVALVKEQGQTFAVLLVKDRVLRDPAAREDMVLLGRREFGVRTVLMGESGGTWGDRDIVRWLESVFVEQLPWRGFSLHDAA